MHNLYVADKVCNVTELSSVKLGCLTIMVTIAHVILSEAKNLHEDAVFLRDSSLRSE